MPKPHMTDGKPNDLVPIQIKVPLWLKLQALTDAKGKAQDMSEWVREAMRSSLRQSNEYAFKQAEISARAAAAVPTPTAPPPAPLPGLFQAMEPIKRRMRKKRKG